MFIYEKVVPFYDVDSMRVVYHGNYIKYLDEARCAFLEKKNLTYTQMEELGIAFPIVQLKVKYIKPSKFNDILEVLVSLDSFDNFLTFKYEIRNKETKEKICKAETKQMCVDVTKKESLFEIPQEIVSRLK